MDAEELAEHAETDRSVEPPLVVESLLRRAKRNAMDGSVVPMDAVVHVDYARMNPSA